MLETLSILPLSFWVVIVLLGVGAILAVGQIKDGTGLPMLPDPAAALGFHPPRR